MCDLVILVQNLLTQCPDCSEILCDKYIWCILYAQRLLRYCDIPGPRTGCLLFTCLAVKMPWCHHLWYPRVDGAGIKDFETMEHLFLVSNATAFVTRYTSKYQCRAFLDLFLQQNNNNKYTNLGLMIWNNYRQALDIIKNNTPLLKMMLSEIKATRMDLDVWQEDQTKYFSTLGKEPEDDIHRVAYIELLQELAATKYISRSPKVPMLTPDVHKTAANGKTVNFLNAVPENWDPKAGSQTYQSNLSQTRTLESMRKYAREKVDRVSNDDRVPQRAAIHAQLQVSEST